MAVNVENRLQLLMSNIRTLQNELVGATQSQKQGLVNFLNLQLILHLLNSSICDPFNQQFQQVCASLEFRHKRDE